MDDPRSQLAHRIIPGSPATFDPGEELRCPGRRHRPGAGIVPCLYSLHLFAKSRMIVRPRQQNSVRIAGGTEYHCRNCRTVSDVYPVREEIRLSATG